MKMTATQFVASALKDPIIHITESKQSCEVSSYCLTVNVLVNALIFWYTWLMPFSHSITCTNDFNYLLIRKGIKGIKELVWYEMKPIDNQIL